MSFDTYSECYETSVQDAIIYGAEFYGICKNNESETIKLIKDVLHGIDMDEIYYGNQFRVNLMLASAI